jgi:phosphatidate cytidylyltransferase
MGAFDEKNRRNLALRVASGLALFPIAVWLTLVGGLPFGLLAGAAAAVCAIELVLMFGRIGTGEAFGIAFAGAIPLMAAYAHGGAILPGWAGLAFAAATVVLLTLFLFRKEPLELIPRSMSTVALAWFYCGLLIASLVGVRIRFGFAWVIMAFVVAWLNDTAAYFAGHTFGRHPMFARISPKKTWEGFAGGIAGSVVGALVVRWLFLPEVVRWLSMPARIAWDGGGPGIGTAVLVGLGAAVLGPLGDLAESMVKRAAGVKDSGRTIPGHGGLLDRIDALLFIAPWIYVCAGWVAGAL